MPDSDWMIRAHRSKVEHPAKRAGAADTAPPTAPGDES